MTIKPNTGGLGGALAAVQSERLRQYELMAAGRFKYTPSEVDLIRGFAMLSEEVGEVARALLAVSGYVQEDLTMRDVRTELVQVGAITIALIERTNALIAGTGVENEHRGL